MNKIQLFQSTDWVYKFESSLSKKVGARERALIIMRDGTVPGFIFRLPEDGGSGLGCGYITRVTCTWEWLKFLVTHNEKL